MPAHIVVLSVCAFGSTVQGRAQLPSRGAAEGVLDKVRGSLPDDLRTLVDAGSSGDMR